MQTLFIAYSGGVDSHVLLHICASQPDLRPHIVAVHVHHGLQQAADAWAEHCRAQCQTLGVDFRLLRIDASPKSRESPEAAARRARYAALRPLLADGDVLLVGQHREDQMETLLLQLFRGGGINGLAAMPAATGFGRGQLLRPLLAVGKQTLLKYARDHALQWVEDPSNANSSFDRNFLRNDIIPLLKQRWPELDKTVARSARHCAEAASILDGWAERAAASLTDAGDQALRVEDWQRYRPEQRKRLLRAWLQGRGQKPPSAALLANLEAQLTARADAMPEIQLKNAVLRRYRQKLYCLPLHYLQKQPLPKRWPPHLESLSLANGYRLLRREAAVGIDPELWHSQVVSIAYRSGGEKLKLPHRDGQRDLKNLYQEAGIPPWEREVRPLIYLNGRLAAVAGLWVAEWAALDAKQDSGYWLDWLPDLNLSL
jgi:tRNA(Ile)-lysidine synthase